jgi:hypothetical protein
MDLYPNEKQPLAQVGEGITLYPVFGENHKLD